MIDEMLITQLMKSEQNIVRLSRILSYVLVKFHNGKVEIPLEALSDLEEGGVSTRKIGESIVVSGFASDEVQDKYNKEHPAKNEKYEKGDMSEILSKLSDLLNKLK